ncbi:MAG: hypothetical protein AAFN68_11805, partial [Pseudomonadota bacterium]
TLIGLMLVSSLLAGSAVLLSASKLQATEPVVQMRSALSEGAIAAEQTCEFFSSPQRYNTQYLGADGREVEALESAATVTTIVIGQQSSRPYQVVIPGGDVAMLRSLRSCILDAFASQARFGPYLHMGSFGRRRDAEGLKRILTREGYRARVIYRR